MNRKVLIVLSGVVLLSSSVAGLVLIDDGSDNHRVSAIEIDKPVSQSIELISYDSLSTTQQELFRNIRDSPVDVGSEPAISSGTVVQLDGQYYMIKSSVPPTLPISLATIFAFLDIPFIFVSFFMFG